MSKLQNQTLPLNYPVDAAPTATFASEIILRDGIQLAGISGNTQLNAQKAPGVIMELIGVGVRLTNKDGQARIVPYSNIKSITPK